MRLTMVMIILFILMFGNMLAQDLTGFRFCLDPGHDSYPQDKPFETRINLRVARFLKSYLEAYGAEVILTHNDTIGSFSLSSRAGMANSFNADFFQSLHHNAYLGTANYSVVIYSKNYSASHLAENQRLSQIESTLLQKALYTTAAYVWKDYDALGYNLGVLSPLTVPGVLSEASFWDYKPEIMRLDNLRYLQLEAKSLFFSFLDYYDIPRPTSSTVFGQLKDSQGNGIPFTSISLMNGQDTMTYQTDTENLDITDADNGWWQSVVGTIEMVKNGFFFFENFPAGPAELKVSSPYISVQTSSINVVADDVTEKNFTINQQVPPLVSLVWPSSLYLDRLSVEDSIVLKFTNAMHSDTEGAIELFPNAGNLSFRWSSQKYYLTIIAENLEYNTRYEVRINGEIARDLNMKYLDQDQDGMMGDTVSFYFQTRPDDQTAPEIVQIYPAVDQSDASSLLPVMVLFDEKIDTLTGIPYNPFPFYVVNANGGKTVLDRRIYSRTLKNRSAFFISADNALQPATQYYITIKGGFRDLYGNSNSGVLKYYYTTQSVSYSDPMVLDSLMQLEWSIVPGFSSGLDTDQINLELRDSLYIPGDTIGRAMILTYRWDELAAGRASYWRSTPPDEGFVLDYDLLWPIMADSSSDRLRFILAPISNISDSSQYIHSDWTTLDFWGWRTIRWDLQQLMILPELRKNREELYTLWGWEVESQAQSSTSTSSLILKEPKLARRVMVDVGEYGTDASVMNKELECLLYPNPFNNRISLRGVFAGAKANEIITIEIFDMLGRKLVQTSLQIGQPQFKWIWDGRDRTGNMASSGIYLVRVSAGSVRHIQRILMMQ